MRAVRRGVRPGVVASRDRLAAVGLARSAEEGAELHDRVALDAGARGFAPKVGRDEGRHHPGVELTFEVHHVERDPELTGDPAGKFKRVLTLKNGNQISETSNKYKPEDKMFSYYIDKVDVKDLPANDYSATITVEPEGNAKSKVEWKAAFYRGYMNNDPPPELNDEAAIKAVKALYRAGLDNLKAKVEKGGS